MTTDAVYTEIVRLSQHSLRLRAYLRVLRDNPQKYVPADAQMMLRRLIKDVKLKLGEPIAPVIDWPYAREPKTFSEAQTYLQRPELFGTENYQAMLWHADLGRPATKGRAGTSHVDAGLVAFAKRLVGLATDRRVPLFVERGYTSPQDQNWAYVTGLSDIPAKDFPYCYGKAVLIGHAAEREFRGMCLVWLNTLADLAAAELNLQVGYGFERPGEFLIADADGVFCELDGNFPDPHARDEMARLFDFYSAREWVAAEGSFTVEVNEAGIGWVKPSNYVDDG